MRSGAFSRPLQVMHRRDALKRLAVLLGSAFSLQAEGLLAQVTRASQSTVRSTAGAKALSARQFELAGALAESILPKSDTPGALDAGVDHFLDSVVAAYLPESDRQMYLEGLDQVDELARSRFESPFVQCNRQQQSAVVAELDRSAFVARTDDPAARFFRLHKELTVLGYFTSEVGEGAALRRAPYGEFESDIPLASDEASWA